MSGESAGGVRVFGVRHLSPAAAGHLLDDLDAVKPTAVLIEGPSDASGEIRHLVAAETEPPVALLAFTDELPVRTVLWPFADYSPEYQAMRWAYRAGAHVAFIDLPASVNLALQDVLLLRKPGDQDQETAPEPASAVREESLYETIARMEGEPDYDTYWERRFEHNTSPDAYRSSIWALSAGIRELTEGRERQERAGEHAYNAIREAYMVRCIKETIAAGHKPEKIVVVCGAYHAWPLSQLANGMSDEELASLPSRSSKLTLMPYSYYRLSNRSGYGAGNAAPGYFARMWEAMQRGSLQDLPFRYLTEAARLLRESGTHRSAAEVIEAVRLAEALAALHGGSVPALRDLRDAAVTLLGRGDRSVTAEALARLDIGTAIGRLAEGVSQTPVQDDFNRQLTRLKLTKYKTAVAAGLTLDLRENRRVSSGEAAMLDLHRSRLLHRLALLEVPFASERPSGQDSASWKEEWSLQWSPESEISLVEATLLGETVELACAYVLQQKLEACTAIGAISVLIRIACLTGLTAQLQRGAEALQRLSADSRDVVQIAAAVRDLSLVISYGSIRRVDTEPLKPLLSQLFLRASLFLNDAAGCNVEAATGMSEAVAALNAAAQEHAETVDEDVWRKALRELSERDDRNPRLSGLACALLLERGELTAEEAGAEVSRRLSPGIPAELGAGWFEGLSQRNRYALLSRMSLWEQLDRYIRTLDEKQFLRALVFLRRAFGSFSPREKTMVAELLGELWGVEPEQAAEALSGELKEEDQQMLADLDEFDFEDF